MIPVALRITNFRGFKKTQEFKFAGVPGLYFMQGVNESEPKLGSNGAGKSTIWDALTWLWFGKTPRGLKAGDVSNWEAGKGTSVEFDFIHGSGEDITVVRTWGPIKFYMHSTGYPDDRRDLTKDPAWLDGLLGLDFTTFLNVVLTAQSQPMFLDMKQGPQAELFSNVMQLDTWLTQSEKASKAASDQDRISRKLEREIDTLEGELQAVTREDPTAESEAWEARRAARLESLGIAYEQALDNDYSKQDLEAAEEAERNARAALHNARLDEALEKAWGRAKADMHDYGMMSEMTKREAEKLTLELELLEGDEPCSSCGQRMTPAARTRAIRTAALRAQKLHDEAVKHARNLDEARQRYEELDAQMLDARDAESKARSEVQDCADDTAARRRERALTERALDNMEAEADQLQKEVNPFKDMQQRRDTRLAGIQRNLHEAREDLDTSERKRSLYSYWVRGFKEVRLGLIGEALIELEVEANSGVEALGLRGWELRFQVDRENKGGGVQRGFSVGVKSPLSVGIVPWEAWSGGEAQRLRIAAQMGVSDLARSRTGVDIPLEVWDEPTAGLSPGGVDDLLEALRARAIAEGREIWVVDHRTHAFGGFDGGATIIKTPSGSRIRMSV